MDRSLSTETTAAAAQLDQLGVAHRLDEDVVAGIEGNWFVEINVTGDLTLFAMLPSNDRGTFFAMDVRSCETAEPVETFGESDRTVALPSFVIAPCSAALPPSPARAARPPDVGRP